MESNFNSMVCSLDQVKFGPSTDLRILDSQCLNIAIVNRILIAPIR
jgi:hypothetical protein